MTERIKHARVASRPQGGSPDCHDLCKLAAAPATTSSNMAVVSRPVLVF
jgi:hypothetical protein